MYRQCLLQSQCIALCVRLPAMSYFAALGARGDYLLRHITRVGVDGSGAVNCGVFGGKVNGLDRDVLAVGPVCRSGTSSVRISATEALGAFFFAMR
jgi:hypothetical protein